MNEKARIGLAEAMGWIHSYDDKPEGMTMNPQDGWWKSPDGGWSVTLDFDPSTDANDDYAVLEWALENLDVQQLYQMNFHLDRMARQRTSICDASPMLGKRTGDNAHAACTVLKIELKE